MPDGKILVTGAGGFVGQALCAELEQKGFSIIRVVRHATTAQEAGGSGKDAGVVCRDVGPDTQWDDVLDDVSAVIHLAARTHSVRKAATDAEAYARVNVGGTRALARSAARRGIRKFLFVSSVKVNGEQTTRPFNEEDRPDPRDDYGRTKLQAEDVLREIAAGSGMSVCILRPPLMYGPGVKGNLLGLFRAVRAGAVFPLASIRNRRSLLYVGNLVSAIAACLADSRSDGQTYLLSDGDPVSTPELIRSIARAMDRNARLVPFPMFVLEGVAAVLGKREQMERLAGSLEVDSARIRRELGWRPPFHLDQGMAETARWFESDLRVRR